MKFSVASKICDPDAEVPGGAARLEESTWPAGGSAMVAGRLTRMRSVARWHSIYHIQHNAQPYLLQKSHTPHSCLNVSKSTKCSLTVSSLVVDLYCLRSRLQISVYSVSGKESLT